jgi:hypothetical protein
MPTPYGEHLEGRDPVDALRTSLADYRTLISRLAPDQWSRPWSPGKWTVAQVVLHVAQWEMIFGVRVRCGLTIPHFTVQPMNQDPFVDLESPAVDGPTAAAALLAMKQMNLALAASLTPAQRAIAVTHPERGQIDVNDMLVTLAGHGIHHLKQLQ